MKIHCEYKMIVVVDSKNNVFAEPITESGDTVQVCNLVDEAGERLYFESEAYHLPSWCKENKLKYLCFERDEDVEIDLLSCQHENKFYDHVLRQNRCSDCNKPILL